MLGFRFGSQIYSSAKSAEFLKTSQTSLAKTRPSSSKYSNLPTKSLLNLKSSYHTSSQQNVPRVVIEPLVAPEPVKTPTSLSVPIINLETGEATGTVDLKPHIFAAPVRQDLLHTMVVWHLANCRKGLASTKGRGEVAGSTRKIFKQKGTGNARAGTVRAPHRKGSGAAHGPHNKDWSFKVNKKVRKLAMISALSAKFAQGNLTIVDKVALPAIKTKQVAQLSEKFNWEDGGAFVVDGQSTCKEFLLASRNLPHLTYKPHCGLDVYTVLRRKHLVLTKEALEVLDCHVNVTKTEKTQ